MRSGTAENQLSFLWRLCQNPLDFYPQVCKSIGVAMEKTRITITTEDLVAIPQAAKEIGVNFSTIYRWIKNGKVRPFRIGAQVFLTVDDVKALKEEREATTED